MGAAVRPLEALWYPPAMPLQDDYQVRLDTFEGPLDLLLYLIRRAEVDIHDIPIVEITEHYLAVLDEIDRIDIEQAGDFLVMAATLIEIKSRTLAPRPEPGSEEADDAEEGEAVDPRRELVQQLLAYQRYRNAAEELDERRHEHAARWTARVRGTARAADADDDAESESIEMEDAHVLDLIEAYQRIIEAIDFTRVGDHTVEYDDTPITLHQADLVDRLEREPNHRLSLRAVFEGRKRSEMLGLFLATLELARQQRIRVVQDDVDDEIGIELAPEEDAATEAGTEAEIETEAETSE